MHFYSQDGTTCLLIFICLDCHHSFSYSLFFQGEVQERWEDAEGQAGQDRDDAAGGQEEGRQRHTAHLARRR